MPGRRMLDAGNRAALQALLFRVFFWPMDLSLFVGWLARRVPGRWPQNDIGVVLWALAGVAERMAKRRHARRVVHRSREPGRVWVPRATCDAVRVARSRAAMLVRSNGMERNAGDVRRPALAQDRFVRTVCCLSASGLRTAGRVGTSRRWERAALGGFCGYGSNRRHGQIWSDGGNTWVTGHGFDGGGHDGRTKRVGGDAARRRRAS